jgi:hypothetical protein
MKRSRAFGGGGNAVRVGMLAEVVERAFRKRPRRDLPHG